MAIQGVFRPSGANVSRETFSLYLVDSNQQSESYPQANRGFLCHYLDVFSRSGASKVRPVAPGSGI
jgi:hypothetical protein